MTENKITSVEHAEAEAIDTAYSTLENAEKAARSFAKRTGESYVIWVCVLPPKGEGQKPYMFGPEWMRPKTCSDDVWKCVAFVDPLGIPWRRLNT